MKRTLLTLAILTLTTLPCIANEQKKPKYIFLFIGDGMGLAQISLTNNYSNALNKDSASYKALEFLKMPVVGIQTTHSANKPITDSAAAGTALATGVKTNNGMIGISPEGDTLRSIAEILHDKGYRVGIISTMILNHATPAAFYAKSSSRKDYKDIANQLPKSRFEFFGGKWLKEINLKYMESYGYSCLYQWKNRKYNFENRKVLLSPVVLAGEIGGSCEFDVELPEYVDIMINHFVTSSNIDNLTKRRNFSTVSDKPKEFFAMIEGGNIDVACHYNDAATMINEVLELDSAYQEAYEFYLKYPDETLIIVTADHETGGLSLGNTTQYYDMHLEYLKFPIFSKNHTLGSPIYYVESPDKSAKDSVRTHNRSINEKAGIAWTTYSHTSIPVPVFAIGCGAEIFSGVYDNTDIPKKILKLTEK